MIIRAGFKTTCIPAGIAEAVVTGDMCREDAEDAILLLELTIKSIRRQIAASEQQTAPREDVGK